MKCLELKTVEYHHVMPRRFYGKKNNTIRLLLCSDCHREIEKILPHSIKLTRKQYLEIHVQWLRGQEIFITFTGREKRLVTYA